MNQTYRFYVDLATQVKELNDNKQLSYNEMLYRYQRVVWYGPFFEQQTALYTPRPSRGAKYQNYEIGNCGGFEMTAGRPRKPIEQKRKTGRTPTTDSGGRKLPDVLYRDWETIGRAHV